MRKPPSGIECESWMSVALPILLVEDDLSLAQTLSMLLENQGLQVEQCATGEVAIELVRSKRYAVVVIDIILQTGISGIYVVSAIRELPSAKRPQVMMMTGASLEVLRGVDRSVVTAVMLKPVDFELFSQYVLAMYRRALGVPSESGLTVTAQEERVRTFCGNCGSEVTPWIAERQMLPRVNDDTLQIWRETPCPACGSAPLATGARTEWRA
jgi:two-component system, chemotaxis family, chemotaxis protein CheY